LVLVKIEVAQLRTKVGQRERYISEFEVGGINVSQLVGVFLFYYVSENAEVFIFLDFDGEDLLWVVIEKEAPEGKALTR
jgi:hypothetical protein